MRAINPWSELARCFGGAGLATAIGLLALMIVGELTAEPPSPACYNCEEMRPGWLNRAGFVAIAAAVAAAVGAPVLAGARWLARRTDGNLAICLRYILPIFGFWGVLAAIGMAAEPGLALAAFTAVLAAAIADRIDYLDWRAECAS